MLSFANPAALLALLGLLVPLAIHLWNRRPGRVVPVGALRWLTAGANRRMRQLHLTQWPLLLLRFLLLLVLVALLAGPRWAPPARPARPQVLVAPAVLASPAWPVLRPTVDSLRRAGAELRAFAPGFPLLPDSAAVLAAARRATDPAWATDWYWPRAAEAADSFPSQSIFLFTPAGQAHFRGSRPALPARLRWQLVPTDSAARPWLVAAARPHPDSLVLTVAYPEGANLRTARHRLAWPGPPPQRLRVPKLPPLQLTPAGTIAAQISFVGDSTAVPVAVQQPLRIVIGYANDRREDLRYLRAALRAAAPALPAGLQLRTLPLPAPANFRADSLDWLFWLADAPLPAAVTARLPRGLQVLRDAPGPGQPAATTFNTTDSHAEPLHRLLRRGGTAPAPRAAVRWADATGRPVLTSTRRGRGAEYQLFTRLHPQWSSLPDDGLLPGALLPLLAPATALSPNDPRPLDAAQLRAAISPAAALIRPRTTYRDLRPWVALAAGLLFGLERLLASRRLSSATA